ncbi:MAG: glycosyltransferase, partial [Chloroflexi bacterium]|nr:glycosyltransferase [Chloroflexota bacterium]
MSPRFERTGAMSAPADVPVSPPASEAAPDYVPHLSLIIPAYNEAERLGSRLASLISYLESRPYTTELLVISDGSTDATRLVVEAAFAGIDHEGPLRAWCLEYFPNGGKGRAVRT